MDDSTRRSVIASQSQAVKRALADVESQQQQHASARRRVSLGALAVVLLLLCAWRGSILHAPFLVRQAASEATMPMTAASLAAIATPVIGAGNFGGYAAAASSASTNATDAAR